MAISGLMGPRARIADLAASVATFSLGPNSSAAFAVYGLVVAVAQAKGWAVAQTLVDLLRAAFVVRCAPTAF